MNEINTINETNTITTSNTGKEPMKNLAHEITYRRYLLSKDDAKSIFKDIRNWQSDDIFLLAVAISNDIMEIIFNLCANKLKAILSIRTEFI